MKTITLIRTSLAVLFASVSCLASAQTTSSTSDWTLLHEKDGIQIYSREESCSISDQYQKPCDYAFLKIVNTTPTEKFVYYNFGLLYTEECNGCQDDTEFSYGVSVPANDSLEGDCSFGRKELSRIIRNPNLEGGWNFEQVNITNPQID